MSMDALEQFRAKLATDAALQKACLAAMNSGNTEDVLAEGRKLGLEFTASEVQQRMADAELSEFELELVAAGSSSSLPFAPTTHGPGSNDMTTTKPY